MLIVAAHLLAVVMAYVTTNLLGYWTHRWLHATKTEARASHDYHHETYPVHDFWDEEYRHPPAEKEQIIFYTVPGFIIVGLAFWLFSWQLAVTIIAATAVSGRLNQYVHDSIHINGHWLERFSWFWRLRNIHMLHHYAPYKINLGILSFWPDRVFGSYVEPSELDFRMHLAVARKRHESDSSPR